MARNQIDGGGPTPVSTSYKPKPTKSVISSSGVSKAELDRLKQQAAARPLGVQLSGAHGGIPTSHGLAPLTSIGASTSTSAARPTPIPTSGGGGGGYGGGGGVGGGGGAAGPTQATFDAYMAAMQKLLGQTKPVQAMVHPLTGKIDPAMAADIKAAQAAFRGIPQQTNNPFTGMQFQAPTLSPSLQRFVESQGGDVGAYQNQVAASNVGLQSGAADWNSLAQVLGGNVTAAQQDARAANDMQLQAIVSALRGQGSQMNAGVAMQQAQFEQQAREQQAAMEAARQQALAQALSTGLQYGFTPPKGF